VIAPVLVAAMVIAAAAPVCALPKKEDAIDPSRRAPVSTAGAVRPAATTPTGTGIVGDGRLPVARANIPASPVATPSAPIVVTETRPKTVKKPGVRKQATPRVFDSKRAADQPASIPRLDSERFRKTLTQYREGTKSAADLAHQRVRVGEQTVDLAEINRFANPRATLESQGIPVVSAGSADAAEASSVTVPISGKDAAPSK